MRLVFFGSGEFGCPTLSRLVSGDHEIVAVFTRPDQPAGRGRSLTSTPIKKLARKLHLPLYEHVDPNDQKTIEYVRELAPTVAIVVDYGHLISPDLFNLPPEGFINLHASLLPAFRGAAPVPHAILAGVAETGVTAFRINARFDEGDVLGRVAEPIADDDTAAALLERLAPVGAQLIMEVLGRLEAGWITPVPQSGETASRAPKLSKETGRVRWTMPAAHIERQVRALQPWPMAYATLPTNKGPVRVNLLAVDVIPDDADGESVGDTPPPSPTPSSAATPASAAGAATGTRPSGISGRMAEAVTRLAASGGGKSRPDALAAERLCSWGGGADGPPPGTILWADQRYGLVVRAADGLVRLAYFRPEGRGNMTDRDFVRGTRVECGARLL